MREKTEEGQQKKARLRGDSEREREGGESRARETVVKGGGNADVTTAAVSEQVTENRRKRESNQEKVSNLKGDWKKR